jgi:hypothetical protein
VAYSRSSSSRRWRVVSEPGGGRIERGGTSGSLLS